MLISAQSLIWTIGKCVFHKDQPITGPPEEDEGVQLVLMREKTH